MRVRVFAFILAAFAWNAAGQVTNVISSGIGGTAQFHALPRSAMRPTVTGAPYSAEEFSEQVQTLADGTHITRKQSPVRMFRDSAGRTRTERTLFDGMAIAGRIPDSPIVIEITDPVGQVKYTLDTTNKVAHRQRAASNPISTGNTEPPPAARQNSRVSGVAPIGILTSASAETPQPQTTSEKLGSQTIEGVMAEGTRNTVTGLSARKGTIVPFRWYLNSGCRLN